MRKFFPIMMLVAAAAMTFASCQKQEMNDSETFSTTLTLNAEVPTKTYLEDNTILWGVGETVNLYLAASEGAPVFRNSTPNDAISGKTTASFEFALENIANGPYTIGGIYPASAVVEEKNEKAVEYKVILPAIQNAEPGKYDPSAFIMVLKPETMDQLPETHMASFRRAVALNKITLTGVTEAISSVTISVPDGKELHGRRYFDLTTGNSGDVYNGTDRNKITVNSEYTPTGETNSFDVWFTSWGVELSENEELTIQMTSATGIYTRTIAARAEGIKFLEGDLNTLTVNMASAQKETFENLSGEYLLVSSKNNVWSIMSQTVGGTSTKYINAIATSVNAETVSCEDFYNVSGVENYVWTVAQAEGGYTFATIEGQYLTYPGSGNASDLSETSTVFGLQVDNTNKAMITYTTRALKYYSTSPRFAFYESAQQDVYLIPWAEDLTKRIIVDNNAYDVNAADTSFEFGYFVKNIAGDPTVSVKAGATMSGVSASVSADKVTVSFAANNDTIEKTAIIVLSYEGAEPVEVTITQAAKVEGTETPTEEFVLVTSLAEVTTGEYVIAANVNGTYYAMKNTFGTSISSAEMSVSNGVIDASNVIEHVVTITRNGNGVSIFNGTNYIGHTATNSTNLTKPTSEYVWSIAMNEELFVLTSNKDATRSLRLDSGTSKAFKAYKAGSAYKDLSLFKKTTSN